MNTARTQVPARSSERPASRPRQHQAVSGYRPVKPIGVAAGIVGLLAAGYLAICGYTAVSLTEQERQPFFAVPEQYGLTYENVQFMNRADAIPLDGWLILPSETVGVRRPVVVLHGKGVDRTREADNHILDIAAALVRDRHPLLLFDLRGSGRSGGDHYTLGAKEVWDMGGAIDFLARRGPAANGVDLLGYSMGGATALLDAPSESLVRAVVEDSAYADLGDLIDDQLPKASHLPGLFTPGTVLLAKPLVGIDLYSIRPVDHVAALARGSVPLLVIHGEAGTTIPVTHAQRIAAAYGSGVKTLLVPGAEHVRSYESQPQTYLDMVTRFLDEAK